MSLFRFQDTASSGGGDGGDSVNVVLGLRRLDAMQWEGWCFQLTRRESSLPPALVSQAANRKMKELIRSRRSEAVTAAALRNTLGDDSRLFFNATVTGVQLQGRCSQSTPIYTTQYQISSRQVPDILHLQPQAPPSRPPPSSSLFQTLQIHPPELGAREHLPTSPKPIYAPSQGAEYYARSADHSFRYSELRDEESISLTALNAALTRVYRWPY
ncbi:hypothetical protein DL771_006416 [Monosporascus sp. 5C6A]|nr:hypothetical protein DL771_006416 [Monosporascus sp. 5C6A]